MPKEHLNAKVRRSAGIYFLFQGVVVFIWWSMMAIWPETRRYFLIDPNSETSLLSFWLSDLTLLGPGSIFTAWLFFKDSIYAPISTWFISGVVAAGTLYCFAFAMFTDAGWLGLTLMFAATIFSGVFAVGASFSREMFQMSGESSTVWIVVKTLLQIVVVWSVILVVFPYLITIVERKIGILQFDFAFQQPISAFLFVVITSLGIWAAVTMARVGRGTPLPLDHAKHLVVIGPYAHVRNPMAVSGIGQGLAVALFLGSPLVAIYALMGSLIWQLVFRPLEEADLHRRFGAEYEQYCREVKCWIPRPTPYHSDGAVDSSNSSVSPLG
jgi:protein-S-isoprenylcysteine O-methyltransferase Ste14